MQKFSLLNRIRELYEVENTNITAYLKKISNSKMNNIEDILISYDFQAGEYTKRFKADPTHKIKECEKIANIINGLGDFKNIIEVGVGEASTLATLVRKLKTQPEKVYGLDLSWSRIKVAKEFLHEMDIRNVELFTGDLFDMPIGDNSIDLVYTVHAVEPNGGKEREALQELYRIAGEYLVLVEPCYEIASPEAKSRMDSNGYIKGLYDTAISLGYNVIMNKPLEDDINELNPASILVIKKDEKDVENISLGAICCPITKTPLEITNGCYYSKESLLAYPIVDGIPCLLSSNAIVATKMLS